MKLWGFDFLGYFSLFLGLFFSFCLRWEEVYFFFCWQVEGGCSRQGGYRERLLYRQRRLVFGRVQQYYYSNLRLSGSSLGRSSRLFFIVERIESDCGELGFTVVQGVGLLLEGGRGYFSYRVSVMSVGEEVLGQGLQRGIVLFFYVR